MAADGKLESLLGGSSGNFLRNIGPMMKVKVYYLHTDRDTGHLSNEVLHNWLRGVVVATDVRSILKNHGSFGSVVD